MAYELADLRPASDTPAKTKPRVRARDAARLRDPERLRRHLTGVAVRKLNGRAPAKQVAEAMRARPAIPATPKEVLR